MNYGIKYGWDHSSYCKAFEYMVCETSSIAVGGRVLAGWENPRIPCYPPTLCFLSYLTKEKQEDFLNFLHQTFNYTANIPPMLIQTMCASILCYLDTFISTYTVNHIVVRTLSAKAQQYGFSLEKLLLWGKEVENHYKSSNLRRVVLNSSSSSELLVSTMQFNIANVQHDLNEVRTENKILKAQIKESVDIGRRIESAVNNNFLLSPLKKRRLNTPTPTTPTMNEGVGYRFFSFIRIN